MSEKRLASSGDSFVDLTEMQIVDLLNKLSDENTRLHKKVDEQQATISKLEEEKGYWKSKAMTLLSQVRRLTPRMTAKEVIEFGKELEDE